MMATDAIGLYVHIPYCIRKCNYCDFCSLPIGNSGVPDEYVDRLCEELDSYRTGDRVRVATLYVGGGTPTLLSKRQLTRLVERVRSVFELLPDAEVTLEANPGTVTAEGARMYRTLGFNRVSIGLQSIHENEMKKLGRIHNYDEFLSAYKAFRSAGFQDVNVDLMYGIPYQSAQSFEQTLRQVVALGPEHISAYGLIVEESTPFGKDVTLRLPGQDAECDMYELCCELLRDNGYEHYEISNYAKEGCRSRHNLTYWTLGEYVGVGAAAHSFYRGQRFSNTSDVAEYIAKGPCRSIEDRAPEDLKYELAMLGLRLKDGISELEYRERFGESFTEGREELLSSLEAAGLAIVRNGRISLTEKGFYVSNAIFVELL